MRNQGCGQLEPTPKAELRAQDADRVQQLLNRIRQLELQALETEGRAKQREDALITELETLRANRNEAAVMRDMLRQRYNRQTPVIRRLSEQNKALLQRNDQIKRLVRYIPAPLKHSLMLLFFRLTAPK
jgi:hypothetical protein